MSFPSGFPHVLCPEDLATIRNVFDRIRSEPWVSKEAAAQETFAKYVLRMYSRGMCQPEKLFRLCVIAARFKLNDDLMAGGAEQSETDRLQR